MRLLPPPTTGNTVTKRTRLYNPPSHHTNANQIAITNAQVRHMVFHPAGSAGMWGALCAPREAFVHQVGLV